MATAEVAVVEVSPWAVSVSASRVASPVPEVAMAVVEEVEEATAADHRLLDRVNPRVVPAPQAFPEHRPMPRRRLSAVLVLEEEEEEVSVEEPQRVDMVEVDSREEPLRVDTVEVDSREEPQRVVTGTTEAAIRRLSTMADRVAVRREVSRMPERAALPVQVPDQPEVTLEVVALDLREDRLALDPELDPLADRAVTVEVTLKK